MTTRAAILHAINSPLTIEEIEIPPLKPGQILVRMRFSGVCHSQINEIRGRKGEDKFLPHMLGHEGSGEVIEIAEDVTKVKPKDHVVLTWIKARGKDVPGTTYQNGDIIINSGAIATWATYTVVSENRVVPIPKKMPLEEASLLGCAILTGGGIVRHTMKPQPGNSIAIFGVGGIGGAALLAASGSDCNPIIAIDVHDEKLALASKLGAHKLVNAKKEDPLARILTITEKKGVDFAVEAAGVKIAMEQAFQALQAGGMLAIAGNLPVGEKISIDPFDLIRGKRILGSWGGESKPDEDVEWYVSRYFEKKLPLAKLITHRFRLDDINRAIDTLENEKSVIRTIIECV